jgi:hypothetical protein
MAKTTQRGVRTAPGKRRERERIFCCTLSWIGTVIDFLVRNDNVCEIPTFLKVEESMELTGCVAKVVRFRRRVVRSPCACARKCNARGSCLCGGVRTYESAQKDSRQTSTNQNSATALLTVRDGACMRHKHHYSPYLRATRFVRTPYPVLQ